MLLIPDIHINHKYADRILYEIDKYIIDNPSETDIVFLGDYIYMFNLDTHAINRLLDLIIKHFHSGKNIYILAGNHDWIGKAFVYHQAQQVFDILNKSDNRPNGNKIYFITEPMVMNIGGKDIFFLPYMISKDFEIKELVQDKTIKNKKDKMLDVLDDEKAQIIESSEISQTILSLKNHKNHNHQISGYINEAIDQVVQAYPDITIIHHYYIHDIELPGIKSRFDYGDVALSPVWLENKNIKLISGHIHKAFQIRNYTCCGSVWHTATQESDQIKFLRNWNLAEDSFDAKAIYINPYVEMTLELQDKKIKGEKDKMADIVWWLFDVVDVSEDIYIDQQNWLTSNAIDIKYEEIRKTTKWLFGPNVNIDWWKYDHKDITINLYTDMDYEDLQNSLPKETRDIYQDIKIKKKSKINKISEIDISNLNLQYNYASWQQIAKKYISEKYWESADIYINYLQRMNIWL